MPKVSLALPLMLLAAAPVLRAADTAPASAPAVSTKDFSTPVTAVKSFLQASFNQLDLSQKQDDAAITNTLIIPDAQKTAILANLALTSSSAKLERACADVFGTAATAKTLGSGARDLLTARLSSIEKAPLTITGDTATLQIPADPSTRAAAGSVTLQRSNGEWKIDAASLFSLTGRSPAQLESQTDLLKKITTITDQLTAEVAAKKYPSVRDAYAELQTRIAKVLPATSPAVKP